MRSTPPTDSKILRGKLLSVLIKFWDFQDVTITASLCTNSKYIFIAVTFASIQIFFNWMFLISLHTIKNIALALFIKKGVWNISILYFGQYPNNSWSCSTTNSLFIQLYIQGWKNHINCSKFTYHSSVGIIFQNK